MAGWQVADGVTCSSTCLLPYSTLEPVTASQGVARPFSWRGGLLGDIYQTSLILPLSGGSKLPKHSLRVCDTSCLNDIQAQALNWNVDVFANNVCMNIESRSHHFVFWQR